MRERWITGALVFFACLSGCGGGGKLATTEGLASWPEARGNALRTGGRFHGSIEPPLYRLWEKRAGRAAAFEPALLGDVLIVASTDRNVRVLRTSNGDVVWKRKLDGAPATPIVVGGDRVIVGYANPKTGLLALDLSDGKPTWERTDLLPRGGPVVRGDTLFVWAFPDGVHALEIETGETIWTRELPGRWPAALAHAAGVLVVATETDSVRALSSADGASLWSASFPGGIASAPAIDRGRVYVVGTKGRIGSISLFTGEIAWSRALNARVVAPLFADEGMLFVGGLDGRLYAVDAESGNVSWNVELDGVCRAAPAMAGAYVVVATMTGTCQLVSRRDRRVVHTVDLRRPVRVGPVVTGRRLYAVDDAGRVYAYES